MILLALATAAAPAATSIHATSIQASAAAVAAAERAFARRANAEGQWRAFRATAAPDAIMFVPTVKAVTVALAEATEPNVPVMWWPATIAPSCDGSLGVSTGPWVRAASAGTGTFTTIWRRTASGGYRWQLDHGRTTPRLVAAGNTPVTLAPTCGGSGGAPARETAYDQIAATVAASAGTQGAAAFARDAAADVLVQGEGAMPTHGPAALPLTRFGAALASGHSDDWTLAWASRALIGGDTGVDGGAHDLRVWQWRGPAGWKLVIYETVGLK